MAIRLGFGGATLTNLKSVAEVLGLLELAFDCGIRHFDTAPLYGQGYSEVIYGKFLKGKRDQVTLTTKVGLGEAYETKLPVNMILFLNYWVKRIKGTRQNKESSKNEIYSGIPYRKIDKNYAQHSFEKSLMRLQTDRVDFLLLHEALPSFLTDDAVAYMLDLKNTHKVGSFGVGTNIFGIRTLNKEDLPMFDVLQYEGNKAEVTAEVMSKFSEKIHFHHSCLKDIDQVDANHIPIEERGGFLLAQAALNNPNGKIIFSTRSKRTLKKNIDCFLKYSAK